MHAADFRVLPVANVTETNVVNGINNGQSYLTGSTIPSGAAASGLVDAGKCLVCNITTPANLQGVSTCTIVHSRAHNGTFTTLRQLNSATAYTITLTASSTIPIDTGLTAGLGYIKIIPNAAPSADLALEIGVKQAS